MVGFSNDCEYRLGYRSAVLRFCSCLARIAADTDEDDIESVLSEESLPKAGKGTRSSACKVPYPAPGPRPGWSPEAEENGPADADAEAVEAADTAVGGNNAGDNLSSSSASDSGSDFSGGGIGDP